MGDGMVTDSGDGEGGGMITGSGNGAKGRDDDRLGFGTWFCWHGRCARGAGGGVQVDAAARAVAGGAVPGGAARHDRRHGGQRGDADDQERAALLRGRAGLDGERLHGAVRRIPAVRRAGRGPARAAQGAARRDGCVHPGLARVGAGAQRRRHDHHTGRRGPGRRLRGADDAGHAQLRVPGRTRPQPGLLDLGRRVRGGGHARTDHGRAAGFRGRLAVDLPHQHPGRLVRAGRGAAAAARRPGDAIGHGGGSTWPAPCR